MDKPNYELIILAREAAGLTQAELAKALHVEQGTLSKIENGLLTASDEILEKISWYLEFPKTFFCQEWNPIRIEGHYRRKITLASKAVKECKAKMTLADKHITTLLKSIEIPEPNFPKWDVEIDGSPAMCAQYLRQYWKLPKGRINNLTKILEDNGFIVVGLDLGDLDGCSSLTKDNVPVIYVNKNKPGDRDLLNKAHELGHFVMHFGQKISESRDVEKEAMEFAGEFLLPLKDIEFHLSKLNLAKLADLKRYWRVSMAAIIVKAKRSGFLTDNQYEYLWKQMGALGYRKKEPIEIEREKPTLVQEILKAYLNDLNYSKKDLAVLLQFREDKIDEWYLKAPSKLHVVRRMA
jgi:Zn-dependent peptidase ImmA (M78 family)/transcriptional regulator with XRE-family HTH domain